MSLEWFAAVGTPIILGFAAAFVYILTGWIDKHDRERAREAEKSRA